MIADWRGQNYWLLIGQAPKLLAFDWLSARARHLHFVSVLKRKADFEFVNPKISLQSWLAKLVNRMVVRREIPKGEHECFPRNSRWLFVLNYWRPWFSEREEASQLKWMKFTKFEFCECFVNELRINIHLFFQSFCKWKFILNSTRPHAITYISTYVFWTSAYLN